MEREPEWVGIRREMLSHEVKKALDEMSLRAAEAVREAGEGEEGD